MGTAIVRRGMQRSSNPGYGWAVPNWTYNASQYAPGPKPAPAWPRSAYSVYGGVGDFLTESSDFKVPNWALLVGGAYVLHKMHTGKKVPVRENPYGVLPLIPIIAVGATALGVKAMFSIGSIFSGGRGVGLGLGLGLGGLYAMKKGEKMLGTAMTGAFIGWGIGFAYEASQKDSSGGLLTKGINLLV